MNDVIEIIQKKIKQKKQEGGFVSLLLGTLGAVLLGNLLSWKI